MPDHEQEFYDMNDEQRAHVEQCLKDYIDNLLNQREQAYQAL